MIEFTINFIYNFFTNHVMTSDNFFVNIIYLMIYLIIAAAVFGFLLYIGLSVFLQRFMKLKKMRASGLAFVPVYQLYLLGQFAINKVVGWILFGGFFVVEILNSITDQREFGWGHLYLQEKIKNYVANPLDTIYWLAVVILFIVALSKYIHLRSITVQKRRVEYAKKLGLNH